MAPAMRTLYNGFKIVVLLNIVCLCGLITLRWYKAFNNFDDLNPEKLRPMISNLKEELHVVETSNISSSVARAPKTNINTILHGLHVPASTQKMSHYRVDNIPENTEILPFLKNFKNPCWRETVGRTNSSRIRCLPYFHSVGPRKCGSTDIHRRLIRHPQISSNVMKEIQWLARLRFGPRNSLLSRYLQYFDEAVTKDIIPSGTNKYHDAIIGDFSPTTAWLNTFYWKSSLSRFTSNADVIHHLYPDSKIIVTLRNPVTRSYSDYKHYAPNPTPELFHTKVVATIQEFDRLCRNATNLRQCLYTLNSYISSAFLLIGIHHSYLEDYLRLFPREQILITRVEDRSRDMASALKKMFEFLKIKSLPEDLMEDIAKQTVANKNDRHVPEMFNKTRLILEEFYKPFNDILGNLIGQEYNYNINK